MALRGKLLLLCLVTSLFQPLCEAQFNCSSSYNRVPDNRDLTVNCGSSAIAVEVNLCTAQWSGFDPSTLALNGNHNNTRCLGTVDVSRDPPVIRYQLPVNSTMDNSCRHSLEIIDETPPVGALSAFSKIQSVVINGFIDTSGSGTGIISYDTDLFYRFSCRYPLEYLLNNTRVLTASVSVATNNNSGTFINTLGMSVYNDSTYSTPLVVPDTGLSLRTQVYVEVKATNLTGSFNVLLDHCFATPYAFNASSLPTHDFFTGCTVNPRAAVLMNGVSKEARYVFEAFRFVEHRDRNISSIYLHCILRLCEPASCQALLNSCSTFGRRRRAVEPFGSPAADSATVSLGPIYTKDYAANPSSTADAHSSGSALMVGLLVFGTASSWAFCF